MRIGVCRIGSERVRDHVNARTAEQMVLSGRFAYSGKKRQFVIELLVPNPPIRLMHVHNIPAKIPPAEVGNCRFIPPKYVQISLAAVRSGWNWMKERDLEDLLIEALA